jgi:hypothetical protein
MAQLREAAANLQGQLVGREISQAAPQDATIAEQDVKLSGESGPVDRRQFRRLSLILPADEPGKPLTAWAWLVSSSRAVR